MFYERSNKHIAGLKRSDLSNFLFKHFASAHINHIDCLEFRFRIVMCYKTPHNRMLHEAIRIIGFASVNDNSEHGSC